MNLKKVQKGFTLIEVLVVIAIIAILAAIVLVAINPGQRFKDARISQRKANVESILSAMQQATIDNRGINPCSVPASDTEIKSGTAADFATCLANYLPILPSDPLTGTGASNAGTYATGYFAKQGSTTAQVVITAPASADGPAYSVIR